MLNPDSLAATLNAVNEAFFFDRRLPQRDRGAVARWLAERCGQPGSYESMPAPTAQDFTSQPRVFTGDTLTTRAGMACKLGNEGCRALLLLGVETAAARRALEDAEARMAVRMDPPDSARAGFYCCGSCTVAVWRHLQVGGLDHQEARLVSGLAALTHARQGNGSWRFFPTWYTIWALLDMPGGAVQSELEYVAPRLERYLRRPPRIADPYVPRRQEIARRALTRV